MIEIALGRLYRTVSGKKGFKIFFNAYDVRITATMELIYDPFFGTNCSSQAPLAE